MSTAFSSLTIKPQILLAIEELGFQTLTPIQEKSLPPMLAGRDLLGQSKTGSGKTAAFAIPILEKIEPQERALQSLILCPTRELSTQVATEIRKLARKFDNLQVAVLCGGQPLREQLATLENGVHIAVGTPGRILDLINRGVFELDHLKILILDEADKMLEMGFEEEMHAIMKHLPEKRQTALFSATFPESIQSLSRKYQQKPARVTISENTDEVSLITQFAYDVEGEDKTGILMRVLQQHPAGTTLVFCNQKITVDTLVQTISKFQVSCAALHGDLEQKERDRVMATFRNGSTQILIATDVAARGLDIDHLEMVINYDMPQQVETYIHRIGRTGRAGKTGTAISLITRADTMKLFEIEKITQKKIEKPKLGFKNQHGLGATHREAPMQTLSISGGRKDKLRAGDVVGALTSSGFLSATDIGKIEVLDHCTYVAVSSVLMEKAMEHLRKGKIKGQKFQIKPVKPNTAKRTDNR